ncbi:cytohesin-1 isoform X2 [Bombus affinis]|uniref:cytohesin-1 isoform X2 n=1 Tax=Bombus affinis TaxID=309941 RepID=UPI0021B6FD65|nr:cytohesin-1 isoform X2 [Bombus affinis]
MWQDLDGLGGAGVNSGAHQLDQFGTTELTPEHQKILIDIRRKKTELLLEIQQLKDELGEVVAEMEAMEGGGLAADETKPSNKAKQTSIGRKKFNMDPKKGIEYLIEHNLLAPTPEDVAQFLYKGEGLNKTAIGDYLGERHDFNERVLRAFVELHDFTDLILVQALRQFLWSFRLPGEAQKIDRMMECFAQRYCQLNPNIFTNTDTCYVLSFAIIMLNTSLHNPSVKDKPSVEQFISMNRGINNGGDLPRELLVSLYESIKTEPFKIPEDDGNDLMHTFFNPDKEGWLWKQVALKRKNRIYKLTDVPCLVTTCITFMQDLRKNEKWEISLGIVGPEAFPDDNETKNPSKCLYFSYIVSLCPSAALTETAGGRYKSWKRRWFILNDNCLYYFEYTTDKEPRGIIPLENIQVREVQDRHKPHCFELYAAGSEFIKACKTDSEGKVVEGKHTVYRMSAATDEEKEEWIKCVRQSISHNPFYDMLAARKKKAQKTNVHSKS